MKRTHNMMIAEVILLIIRITITLILLITSIMIIIEIMTKQL